MIQEAITYLIVGSAITLAVMKILARFKKKKPAKVDFKKDKITMVHNCSECSAECMLRDASKSVLENNEELCHETKLKSKPL